MPILLPLEATELNDEADLEREFTDADFDRECDLDFDDFEDFEFAVPKDNEESRDFERGRPLGTDVDRDRDFDFIVWFL